MGRPLGRLDPLDVDGSGRQRQHASRLGAEAGGRRAPVMLPGVTELLRKFEPSDVIALAGVLLAGLALAYRW